MCVPVWEEAGRKSANLAKPEAVRQQSAVTARSPCASCRRACMGVNVCGAGGGGGVRPRMGRGGGGRGRCKPAPPPSGHEPTRHHDPPPGRLAARPFHHRQVFVSKMAREATSEQMRAFCEQAGEIYAIRIPKERETGLNKG